MLRDARREIGVRDKRFHFQTADACEIPYEDDMFDVVTANHVLFYCEDIGRACSEIRRVLKAGGTFVCGAYGSSHMKEVSQLVQKFDEHIILSAEHLYERFGKENGYEILEPFFDKIEWRQYEDYLVVPEPEPLIAYVLSCHGNQGQYLPDRYSEFRSYVRKKTKDGFRITKDAGVFVCKM